MKMKSVKTTIANQCMWLQNHLFLSLVNEGQSVKNSLFTSNIHGSLERYTVDFEGVIL